MPGQALWLSAFGRDDIHIQIAGVLAAKRDPPAIGRKMRIGGLSLEARYTPGHAARARREPNVLRVGESDLRCTHRRGAQQTRAVFAIGMDDEARRRVPET